MSLTFSDRGTAASPRAFRRGLLLSVLVLVVTIGVAGVTTIVEGPRLRSSTIDVVGATQTGGATLTLRSDRALDPLDESAIRIEPEASFSLQQTDLDVVLTFDHPVRSGTEYRITVDNVQPRGIGASSTWTTTFQTPVKDILFLRGPEAQTELVRMTLPSSEPEVLYRAPGIVGFTPVGVVYAVHRVWQDESILELVDPMTGGADRIALAPGDRIVSLASAPWGTSLIVTLDTEVDGRAERSVMAVLDAVGSRTPEIVRGIDGEPLRALKVVVSPVSGQVVALLRDRTIVVYEPLTKLTIPLGSAVELWGFDATGDRIVFVDSLGTLALGVNTREEIRIPAGRLEGFPLLHEVTTLSSEGHSVQRVVLPSLDDGPSFVLVTQADDEGVHTRLLGSTSTPNSVGSLQLSPDGQFLAVEVSSIASPLGYAGLTPEQRAMTTSLVIVDLVNQTIVAETPGYSFVW